MFFDFEVLLHIYLTRKAEIIFVLKRFTPWGSALNTSGVDLQGNILAGAFKIASAHTFY